MNAMAGDSRARRELRSVDRAPRVRPGDSPAWVHLDIAPTEGRHWRNRARGRCLGVDAWLGALIEFRLATQTAGVAATAIDQAATAASSEPRLAPTEPLRRWVRLLAGQTPVDELPSDELPTAVLAERVLAPVPRAALSQLVREAAEEVDDELALRCERIAAQHGLTLESWVLRVGLGAARR